VDGRTDYRAKRRSEARAHCRRDIRL
jgi:hypothetical protein